MKSINKNRYQSTHFWGKITLSTDISTRYWYKTSQVCERLWCENAKRGEEEQRKEEKEEKVFFHPMASSSIYPCKLSYIPWTGFEYSLIALRRNMPCIVSCICGHNGMVVHCWGLGSITPHGTMELLLNLPHLYTTHTTNRKALRPTRLK